MKQVVFAVFLLFVSISEIKSQVSAGELVAIHALSESDMTSLVPMTGSLCFNTDDNLLYVYDGNNWEKMGSVQSVSTSDTLLTVTNIGKNFVVNTNFKDIQNELYFEDDNYYYVSMKLNNTDYIVERMSKVDLNLEERAIGTGTQPSDLATIQGLSFS